MGRRIDITMREALTQDHPPYIGKLNPGCSSPRIPAPVDDDLPTIDVGP